MYNVYTAQTLHQQRMERISRDSEILRRIAAREPAETATQQPLLPHPLSVWERFAEQWGRAVRTVHRFTPHPAL